VAGGIILVLTKICGRTYSRMSDAMFHTGGSRGINDWYLDRQGRGDSVGDDDRADHGPDTWLDRVTGPSAPRGKRAAVGADRRGSRGAPVQRLGRRREPRMQFTPSLRPARTRQPLTEASDQVLAREAALMQQQSSQPLTYTDAVRRLQAAGWRVTKADLQRAIRATDTGWGQQPEKPKTTPPPSPTVPTQTKTSTSPGRAVPSGIVPAVRSFQATEPKPSAPEVARRETERGRVDEAEIGAMQDILRMSQWKVAGPPTTQALPTSRTAPNRPATAARRDRKLAREAALLRGKSARKLSDSEVVRRLQITVRKRGSSRRRPAGS